MNGKSHLGSYADRSMEERLAAKVRLAFPNLAFSHAEINDRGGDHMVLVLDGEYIFRFPRCAHDNNLRIEIAVLTALHKRCDAPIPRYEFVVPDYSFAGYSLLCGTELTAAVFQTLQSTVQRRILDGVVLLLNALHGLKPSDIAAHEDWLRLDTSSIHAAHPSATARAPDALFGTCPSNLRVIGSL